MKKIEIIWRELLYQSLEKGNNRFVQKELASKFRFSTSTIFQALKIPRKMGAVRVGGREFILQDPEKLLYLWASIRNLQSDIVYQTKVDLPVLEIESQMIPEAIFGCYSAYRLRFNDAPADYDRVIIYIKNQISPSVRAQVEGKIKNRKFNWEEIKKRFPERRGRQNLIVLKADPYLKDYGQTTTLAQTFVDLWNLSDWFAKEFVNSLKEEINAAIS